MFSKKISELTPEYIQGIVERRTPEDQEIEFKKTLSGKNGKEDRWITHGDYIGDDAKRDIAKELNAFANTKGGTLVLGIDEDDEKCASKFNFLTNCQKLADQLAASASACSDPKLLNIESVGVVMEGDRGVVVLRVPQSARAPHCDSQSRQCYYRNGDKSEPMSMQQIQDMSVERWQSIKKIEERLHSRPFDYDSEFNTTLDMPGQDGKIHKQNFHFWVAAVRATAVPIERVLERDIGLRQNLRLSDAPIVLDMGNDRYETWHEPINLGWRPILRGIRARENWGEWARCEDRTILADGLVEVTARSSEHYEPMAGSYQRHLPVYLLLFPIAQQLIMIEVFRNLIGRPNLEYALAVEWRIPQSIEVSLPNNKHRAEGHMKVDSEFNSLPDLQMPSRDNLGKFWHELQTDFFQSFGRTYGNIFPIDFETAIKHVLERAGIR
jgi:hypothetical protein